MKLCGAIKVAGASGKYFAKKHDILLMYSKSNRGAFFPTKENSYMAEGSGKNPSQTYYEDKKGVYTLVYPKDWWEIGMLATSSKEREGYPTQKPLALLARVIQASTKEGDVILDPFCGCGTTLVAAEGLQREWIGIDLSSKAVELVISRIKKHQGLWRKINPRTDIPLRTDLGKLISYKSPKNKKKLYGEQQGIVPVARRLLIILTLT